MGEIHVVGQTVLFGFAQVRLFVLCRGWPGNRAPELLFFRYGQKGLCGLRNGPGLVFAWAGGHCALWLVYGLFMDAWAFAEWLACAYGLGMGYIFIYRVWPKVGLVIWYGPGYIWPVGKVMALSYIGMVIGVIGRYV